MSTGLVKKEVLTEKSPVIQKMQENMKKKPRLGRRAMLQKKKLGKDLSIVNEEFDNQESEIELSLRAEVKVISKKVNLRRKVEQ